MRLKTITASVAALALALTGCSSDGGDKESAESTGSNQASSGDGNEVDVVTWWSAGSEKLGLEALVDVFNEQHPDITFNNQAIAGGGGSQAKQKLASDLASGNAPDTYQGHAGAELTADIEAGYLDDVSDLYDEFELRDAFPESLIDRLTVDGKIYSIPSNIHRSNVVWANTAVLKEAGLDPSKPPADIDAWIADMKKVEEAGKIPITVGQSWTQLHLMENVLLADLGPEAYTGLFDGSTDWMSDEVTDALEDYKTILDFAPKDLQSEDWEPAMKPVMDGDAAYNVMGDWALAAFNEADMTAPDDYVYFPVPGTAGTFNFLADSFTMPKQAKHKDGTKAWLETISSPEGQVAFNVIKGAIPSRKDLTDEQIGEFAQYQQDAMADFAEDTIVSSIAHGAALPGPASNAMKDALNKFSQGATDVAGLQKELAAAYSDNS